MARRDSLVTILSTNRDLTYLEVLHELCPSVNKTTPLFTLIDTGHGYPDDYGP